MDNIPGMNLTELNVRNMRKINMITYSHKNLEKCRDRKAFAKLVLKAFDLENSTIKPMYWAVCREAHQNSGSQYLMCIKLKKNKRRQRTDVKNMETRTSSKQMQFLKSNQQDYTLQTG